MGWWGPAPVPRAGGVEAHTAAGACAALRLHYLPAPVEAGLDLAG